MAMASVRQQAQVLVDMKALPLLLEIVTNDLLKEAVLFPHHGA